MKSYHKTSAASTNGALVLDAARKIKKVHAVNTSAAAAFVKIYDKATAPTVGTDVPLLNLTVPAKGAVSLEFKETPFVLVNGLGVAITGAQVHTDSTAVGAGDVELDISYNS